MAGNPIGGNSAGESKVIRFERPGFFAYYCGIHGAADDGSTMAGIIWARSCWRGWWGGGGGGGEPWWRLVFALGKA